MTVDNITAAEIEAIPVVATRVRRAGPDAAIRVMVVNAENKTSGLAALRLGENGDDGLQLQIDLPSGQELTADATCRSGNLVAQMVMPDGKYTGKVRLEITTF